MTRRRAGARPRRRTPAWARAYRRRRLERKLLVAAAACSAAAVVLITTQSANARAAAPFIVVAVLIVAGGALALSGATSWANAAEIGRGLFVSGILGLALFWVQNRQAADSQRAQQAQDRRIRELDAQRQRVADQRDLQLTIGLRHDLRDIVLDDRQLDGFDLARKDLRGARFDNSSLRGAFLASSRLTGADLSHADLQGADLSVVTMRGSGTGLDEVNGRFADLTDADLRRTEMLDADFSRADIRNADLSGAFIAGGTRFRQADLRGANMRHVQTGVLGGRGPRGTADYVNARMAGIDAHGANFNSAVMAGADLCQSDLTGATLLYTDLRQADLEGADLRGSVGLGTAWLTGARFDRRTHWPRAFDPRRHGAVFSGARGDCDGGDDEAEVPPVGPYFESPFGYAPDRWWRWPYAAAFQLRGPPPVTLGVPLEGYPIPSQVEACPDQPLPLLRCRAG